MTDQLERIENRVKEVSVHKKEGSSMEKLPSTKDKLNQHIRRAYIQAQVRKKKIL